MRPAFTRSTAVADGLASPARVLTQALRRRPPPRGCARAVSMAALSPQISLLLALGGATVGILVVLVYCVYECPGINTTTGDYMSRRRLLEAYLE